MSELIDNIVDVSKVSKEFDEVNAMIEVLKGNITTLQSGIRANKSFEDLAKSTKVLNDAIVEGSAAVDKYTAVEKELIKQNQQLEAAEAKRYAVSSKNNAELEKNKKLLKEQQEILKQEIILNDENSGKIEKARASNKLLQMQKEKLKETDEDYIKKIDELNEKMNENNIIISQSSNKLQKQKDNVGNYEESIKNAIKSLLNEAEAQKQNIKMLELASKAENASEEERKQATLALNENRAALEKTNTELAKYGQSIDEASSSSVNMSEGMDMMTKGAASTAKGLWGTVKAALAFIATPLGAVLTVIAGTVAVLVKAFSRSEESMGKLKTVTGALSGVFGGLMNSLKPVVEFIADGAVKAFEGLGNVAEKAMGLVSKGLKVLGFDKAAESVDKFTASTKESAKEGAKLAAMQAEQTKNERELNRIRFEYLKEQEKFRQIRDDVSRSTAERMKANDALGASLMKQAGIEMNILKQALVIANERVKIDGATSENLDKVAEAKANIADMEERINGFQSEQLVNAVGLKKEAAELSKAQAQLITDAQRRLTDAKLNAMEDGEAKLIAISKENLSRQLEDLKANGQLTAELQANLEKVNEKDLQKIRDDFAKQKKEKDAQDLDELLANYEKNVKKQTDILSASYKQQESDLKKQYANGKISKQQYDEQLIALQSKAVKEANDITIASLQKQLDENIVTDEKRAELSAKLRDLQIDNENAVTDAAIKANESKIESDKAAFDKRVQIATDLANAGMELFGAIGDYQAQQAETRIAELDAQQAKSDELYEAQNSNLEKAIMSDARREEAQKKIDTEKAKRDKEIADKKQKEEIRAAKWEKAQALTSAIINTALAATKMFADAGPLGVVLAALSTAAGLASIATIASQPLPAYAEGGVTGSGLALWGEVRPEVAVTPTGQIMYAENPTVQNFDAGTRIFKSVEEFEKNISMSNGQNKGFEFNYEKMSEAMPKTTVNLDASGLWGIVNKQNDRAIMINRRYKIGN